MVTHKKYQKDKARRIELLRNIKELHYHRKLSMRETAQALSIGIQTVVRYCKDIDALLVKELQKMDVKDILRERLADNKRNVYQWWRMFDEEREPYKKAKIIAMVERAENNLIVALQNLGKVPKQAEKLETPKMRN